MEGEGKVCECEDVGCGWMNNMWVDEGYVGGMWLR